jgi:hypothetical protein
MAKQKFRPTRLGGFSGTKAYIRYVEILKKRRNAVGRTFCDAIRIYKQKEPITLNSRGVNFQNLVMHSEGNSYGKTQPESVGQ